MKVIDKKAVFTGNYLRVVKKHFRTEVDEEGIWEAVERTNIDDIGVVVVVTLGMPSQRIPLSKLELLVF
ncbi:hypothetical protein ACFLWZ_03395 [Chloroflexota bacterium]